jgi:serine/threonine protein kinase
MEELAVNLIISHYLILSKLGEGGMGEVYRAKDTKLNRDVAIKILPEAFAQDEERVGRFKREAQVLASLNHPNIATIYGVEEAEGIHALVMELVEGPTLSDRIAAGPIPLDEALMIARQIAEALEVAHERGIIHRDLKPANVKVTSDDKVKVLDFGLAKIASNEALHSDLSHSPTMMQGTQAGMILGTAAYMSPEQAKGKAVDKRSDVWAFGCVLYEMLTGKQSFSGETLTDILAAVVRADPDWDALPRETPDATRRLLHRCLTREQKNRLRDIGEARIAIEEPHIVPPEVPLTVASVRRNGFARWLPWALAGVFAVAALLAMLRTSSPPNSPAPIRFSVAMPEKHHLARADSAVIALSPDGSKLAFVAEGESGVQIHLRAMDKSDTTPIPGTEGASGPFFSPDGQWIGFFADGKLKKTALAGGRPTTLADAPVQRGGAWAPDDRIYYSPDFESGLLRISAAGGVPEAVTSVARDQGERTHRWPALLPGGEVVFVAGLTSTPGNYDDAIIGIYSPRDGKTRRLKARGGFARYSPSGHLLVAREGVLLAVPFNPATLQDTAEGFPVLEGVAGEPSGGAAYFDVAQNGALAYVPSAALPAELSLVLVDRKGNETPLPLRPAIYSQPRFSADGERLAFNVGAFGSSEVWTYDLRARTPLRLTFTQESGALSPIWSPDGKKLVFTRLATGANLLRWKSSDGSGEEQDLYVGAKQAIATDWSRDGKWLAFTEYPTTGIRALSVPDGKVIRLEDDSFGGSFSPDGRLLAYTSSAATPGRDQIFVRSFPESGGKWQVSTEGGAIPRWSHNGKELFYVYGDRMMVADVTTSPAFKASAPRVLFTHPFISSPLGNFDVSPDGRDFIMVRNAAGDPHGYLEVVLNWAGELRNKTASKK